MRQSNQKQKKRFSFLMWKIKVLPLELTVKLTFPANNKYVVVILLWKTTKTAKKVPEIYKCININA